MITDVELEAAKLFNGAAYRNRGGKDPDEICKENIEFLLENDLVVAFPASDDLVEFRGCIDDETGHNAHLTNDGDTYYPECDENCPHEEGLRCFMKQIRVEDEDEHGFVVQLIDCDAEGMGKLECVEFAINEEDAGQYGVGIIFSTDKLLRAT